MCYEQCNKNYYFYVCNDNYHCIINSTNPNDYSYEIKVLIFKNGYECIAEVPENYYFDSSTKTYKECYDTCKYCNGAGTESYNNCIER